MRSSVFVFFLVGCSVFEPPPPEKPKHGEAEADAAPAMTEATLCRCVDMPAVVVNVPRGCGDPPRSITVTGEACMTVDGGVSGDAHRGVFPVVAPGICNVSVTFMSGIREAFEVDVKDDTGPCRCGLVPDQVVTTGCG